jgi:futalosine hydrolase
MLSLVVAATELEIRLLLAQGGWHILVPGQLWQGQLYQRPVTLLVTGIGIANTSLRLGQWLPQLQPSSVWNVGVAGAFEESWPLASVVSVTQDTFADLGAETADGGFSDLLQLGFPVLRHEEQQWGNTFAATWPTQGLPTANGLTLNTITGTTATRQQLLARWPSAQVETLEGAAFFHACAAFGLRAAQIRGLSNYVGPRNREAWQLHPAAEAAQQAILQHLKH